MVDVKTAKTIGPASKQVMARGTFYLATVKVWFDPETISPRRGNGPLTPNPHQAVVIDDSGREFEVTQAGQALLDGTQGTSVPFTRRLRPGESYTTTLVFDLPQDIRNPRLYISTPPPIAWFIIGHENSPLHRRVLFSLEPGARELTERQRHFRALPLRCMSVGSCLGNYLVKGGL